MQNRVIESELSSYFIRVHVVPFSYVCHIWVQYCRQPTVFERSRLCSGRDIGVMRLWLFVASSHSRSHDQSQNRSNHCAFHD
jgi:hypothetical protein